MTDSSGSVVETSQRTSRRRRPVLVWVILIWWLVMTVGWLGGTLTRPPELRVDSHGQPYSVFDYIESAAFVGLKVTAAILLFMLRRVAWKLLLAILVLNILATGYDLSTKGLPPPGGAVLVVSIVVEFSVLIAITWYAWRLDKKGILS